MPVVRGRVVDASGVAVAGAAVYFVRAPVALPDIAASTDARGEVLLSVPAPGEYRLGARAAAGAGEADVLVSPEGADVELRLTPSP
jgi:hypothetical protein